MNIKLWGFSKQRFTVWTNRRRDDSVIDYRILDSELKRHRYEVAPIVMVMESRGGLTGAAFPLASMAAEVAGYLNSRARPGRPDPAVAFNHYYCHVEYVGIVYYVPGNCDL